MIDETLRQLIELLKETSPFVWTALVKQAVVDAYTNLFWAVVFGVTSFIFFRVSGRSWGRYSNDDELDYDEKDTQRIVAFVGLTIGLVFGIFAVDSLVDSASRFANPEFYAIRFILQQIK